ncbi:MAG: alpha/beta hydrolase [Gemmatimonadaceae bacterium]
MIPMLRVGHRVRAAAAAAAIFFAVTQDAGAQQQAAAAPAAQGRLTTRRVAARPRANLPEGAGLQTLSIDTGRAVLLYVPAGYRRDKPAPLMVMLHGAGGNPRRGLSWVMQLADSAGVILVAPPSRGTTWDVVRGHYGPDVALIDRVLAHVFAAYTVDTTRLAIGGFSDGATYALSVGITNGDLFTHVIAFSPGFMMPAARRGAPRLYVSHGTQDQILSIDACSRQIVRRVRDAGYDVRYREFAGGHTVPPAVAREALAWLAGEWAKR